MKRIGEKNFIFFVLSISFASSQLFDYDGDVATRDGSFDYTADGQNWGFQSNFDGEVSLRTDDIDDLPSENNSDFTDDSNNNSSSNNNDDSGNSNVIDDTENTTRGVEILDKIAGGSNTNSNSGTVSF
jgi:hypothetical protein